MLPGPVTGRLEEREQREQPGGRLVHVPRAPRSSGLTLSADWVMWGEVTGADGFHVMAYDVPSQLPWSQGENPFFVSVRGDDAEEISALWGRLAEGSAIVSPLEPAQWAPLYGMLTDRFGVTWVLDVAAPYNG
ncbi:VOC family protein [Streptomyces sp. NBC_01259]|uniref:VOC family protein n=1 Tax=Streptomyces sp. NBC_01259 TaxID=2903800 RepID=UPI00352E5521